MIHHASIGVGDPTRVAMVLAELTGATPMRAPVPPFPQGAWFVVAGDDRGSFVEVLPASVVLDADAPFGVRHRYVVADNSSYHLLLGSMIDAGDIEAVGAREGWRAQLVETGLFSVVKLWIDDTVLVEVLPAGERERYVWTFGSLGLSALESELRKLEATMANVPSGN